MSHEEQITVGTSGPSLKTAQHFDLLDIFGAPTFQTLVLNALVSSRCMHYIAMMR